MQRRANAARVNRGFPGSLPARDSRPLDRLRSSLSMTGAHAMARTHSPSNDRLRTLRALSLAGALAALAACTDEDARGGVQSPPTTVTAVSPPPPAPAPVMPAPPPDYTGTPCAVLPKIENPPTLIGKPTADPAYNALEAAGADAVPCLVLALADPRPLEHPQSMPGTKGDFTVGDLAFFLMVDFGHVDFLRALPPDVAAKVPARGAFAYFDWIVAPGSRERLQARVREQVGTAQAAAAPAEAPLKR
jgi:hypothetical protein